MKSGYTGRFLLVLKLQNTYPISIYRYIQELKLKTYKTLTKVYSIYKYSQNKAAIVVAVIYSVYSVLYTCDM